MRRHWSRCRHASRRAKSKRIVQSDRHYEDVNVLLAEVPELSDSVDAMAVVSSYFEIHSRAEIDGFRTELTSVVSIAIRSTGKITLLSRDFGKRLPSIVEAQEAADTRRTTAKKDRIELMRLFIRIARRQRADPHELGSLEWLLLDQAGEFVSQGSGDLTMLERLSI